MTYQHIILSDLKDNPDEQKKTGFPHQIKAWKKLDNTFSFPSTEYKGALLVLPTGAGKTFTAVRWLCKNILAKNGKIVWLAQSSILLNYLRII